MRIGARLVGAFVLLLSLLGDGAAACASNHIQANLDGFPFEAQSRSMYWAAEGQNATFWVRVFGTNCDGTTVTINYAVQPGTAQPADYSHAPSPITIVNGPGHSDRQSRDVQVLDDLLLPEPVVEQASVTLTSASNAVLVPPTTASIAMIDVSGVSRPALAAGEYEEQEGSLNGGVPVFRGGSTAASLDVPFTVTPGSAAAGADYQAQSSGTVTIPAGQRSAMIPISVVDDKEREGNETLTVSIVGAGPTDASSVTFTIRDNEESEDPSSSIHHPNNRKKYRSTDFRLREIHVFTSDNPGGSGVVTAQFAVRANLKGGKCVWWKRGRKFQKGSCDNPKWKKMGRYEPDFYFLRMPEIPQSRGRIKSYTAYSRAIDAAGNVETSFGVGRNANTFKVKRGKR